ncbi:MAG: hypothetical protein ACI83N_001137, partial [Hydrogenophaga sp.]
MPALGKNPLRMTQGHLLPPERFGGVSTGGRSDSTPAAQQQRGVELHLAQQVAR